MKFISDNSKLKKYLILFLVFIAVVAMENVAVCSEPIQKDAGKSSHISNDIHETKNHGPGLFDVNPGILISQIINFFVMLFILNKFMFDPIGNILDERRKNLGKIKLDTEKENEKAIELRKKYEAHLEKIEEEAYEIRQKAIKDAQAETLDIIAEAKKKAEQIIEKGEMDLFLERQTAWAHIREEVVRLTMLAAEKVVEESLDDDMHRKLISRTIEKLEKDIPDHTQDIK